MDELANQSEDAQRAYSGLSDLPERYRQEFLKALDENPSADVDDLASFIRTKATVHELSDPGEAESETSTSNGDEARTSEAESEDTSRRQPQTIEERVSALEAELRETKARAERWQASAQFAADGMQKRLVAMQAELAGLRQERDNPPPPADQVQPESGQAPRALQRELFLNGIVALIFFVGLAVVFAYLTRWPAVIWQMS